MRIGEYVISTFPIALTVGVVGMFLCTFKRRKVFSLNVWQSGVFTALLTLVGVAGTMLLYFFETGTFGGVSFYGSVFLIPLLMPLVGLLFRLKPKQTLDICGPCVAIMIGCMRVNCFLSGCCGGWEMCIGDFCFAWPTQALDSFGDFAIMAWLLKTEKEKPQSGKLYPMFMVLYSIMRFFLEFLRDTPKDWLYLSHGQWFALLAIVIGFIWLLIAKKRMSSYECVS